MSTNGTKRKLPDGWIVVNSKSYPDRVYYFNVKTNTSTWEEPTLNDVATPAPSKNGRKTRIRKTDKDAAQSRAKTPELDASDNKLPSKRQILRAKRTQRAQQDQPTVENDTPLMRAIKEKMLQKTSKGTSRGQTSSSFVAKKEQSVECTSTTDDTAASPLSNEKHSSQTVLTPQMREILEKMKQGNKSKAAKKAQLSQSTTIRSPAANKGAGPTKSLTGIAQNADDDVTVDSTDSTKTVGRRRARTEPLSIAQKRRPIRKTKLKKNIAQERMDNLRLSLQDDQLVNVKKIPGKLNATSTHHVEDSPPIVHKNAEIRYRELRVKLLREQRFSENQKKMTGKEKKTDKGAESNDLPTVNKLIEQSATESFYEDMEWETIPDEQIMCEVNNIRTQFYMNNNQDETTSIPPNTLNAMSTSEERGSNPLYIVIDTNVFLSNLQAVEEARDSVFRTHSRPIIVIPWTVIRELDYLKEDRSHIKSGTLSAKARKAIRFLHQHFSSKHPRVLGQTPDDVERNKERFAIDCPDDEILQTCLQIRESGKSVVLLSYDKNLCNKAMIHDVLTLGRNDPFEKIDFLNASINQNDSLSALKAGADKLNNTLSPTSQELRVSDEVFEEAKTIIKSFLTVIVAKEMENLFGDNWEKYTVIRPPWTIEDVLKCALKHWMAAVSESFVRRAEPILKDLLPAFTKSPDGGRRIDDVAHVLDRCSDLIQMTKIDKHPDLMMKASNSIDELKQKLSVYESTLRPRSLQEHIGTVSPAEAELRAMRAFDYFEEIYRYARDICGYAAEKVQMPCTFLYQTPEPVPNEELLKQIQPDLAGNINRLIHVLRNALEQVSSSSMDDRALESLFWAMTNFLPDDKTRLLVKKHGEFLEHVDVYRCLEQKQQQLHTGLRQLQELCTHFCRLATYRIGS